MNASTTIQSTQEFRCRSANEVLEIVTRLDPDTGERVVLWEEIQAGFKNAHSIRSGKFVVPFLRGVDLKEIIPRRIVYHPGTVLDVILDDHNCGYSLSHDPNETTLSDIASSRDLCQTTPCIEPTAIYTTVTATSMQLATVTLKDSDIDNKSLVPYSPSMARSHQSSVVMPNAPSLQDVVSTQVSMQHSLDLQCIQIEGLQNKLDKAAEERAKNQEEMKEMQRRQQDTADQLVMKQEELVKKQEEMNEMQKMALDRLAIIHSHVQAVVTQTYELHEYPIPRLFIVLPKATGVFDKIKNPFANQFRLYFLCECGSHTMSENSKTQHEIHLAKHEGYDLEKPTEFFERYGSYILTLMNMIKYGITAAGLIVPPLAGLKIVEGINTTQQHMDYLKKNLSPLVDNAINFLQGVKSKNELGKEVAEDHTEFEQLEALEGADLRQLESYLKVKDKGRVLANLYRIVTSEGHVKWVCFDHYKAAYHQSAVQHLREIVEINRGTFLEEMGRIKIRIATNTQAKQFYDAMVKARGIQELGITLLWDATMSDLRSLANAISKANVVRVAVDGSYFKSSPLDVVNRNQRFNPILQATSNSRIQSLQIGGFDEFFSRISKSALVPAPRLRVFKYDAPPTSKDKDLQIAGDFLRHCSTLTILELKLQPPQLITKAISEMLGKVQTLDSVRIKHGNNLIIARITNGKICNVNLSLPQLGSLAFDDLKLIEKNYLSRLSINDLPRDQVERLAELLRGASSLKHLRIGCEYTTSLTILHSVIPTEEALRKAQALESLKIRNEKLYITVSLSNGTVKDADLGIQRFSDLIETSLKVIQKEHIVRLSIMDVQRNEVGQLANVLRGASSLKHLRVGCDYRTSLTVVDSVISTRETIIQDTGSSCLQTFELMKEGLVPFSTLFYGYSDHIQSYVSFQEGSNVFDMRTWIRQSNISTLEFVRRYGWSIAFYDGGFQTNVSCSDILNGFGDTRTPQLESLRIQSSVADAVVVDEIIWRSPNFKDLGLFVDLDEEDDFIGARTLLDRYATILSFLRLNDSRDYKERWEWFASSFPTRDTLPALESFILSHIYSFRLPSKCIPWIMAMVSAPPQPISPSQRIIQDVIGSQVTNLGSVARRPLTRLKRIVLDQLDLQTQDWKSVIKAIDFSELQILTFWYSNLPLEELRLLVNLIPDNALLKTLDIRHTHAKRHSDPRSLLALLDTLGRKAPSLTIKS